MECTQKLECTQDLYETYTEKRCPEQIGFLGILGAKHPVVKGPNKIGRDPSACQIVLNLNSVSRQHAVLNVLSSKEYMLMDLDSANKTKLLNKTLLPYVPQPIRNGDTVQFGDIFGIFRLLEDDDDLPMTQALDIPDTPVQSRHIAKLYKGTTTMIPESPEVSDRDESFVAPSQPIEKLRLSNSQIIKPFGKTISIHPVSSPKSINSSKKSNTSLNDSFIALKRDKHVSLHEMDTQIPDGNASAESIYTAATQLPSECGPSPSIHDLDTQVPMENLPHVQKLTAQKELHFDIYAANKENDISIFNAETQPFGYDKDSVDCIRNKPNIKPNIELVKSPTGSTTNKTTTSEEELLFDEIDDELIEDFNSQAILPPELPILEEPKNNTDDGPKPETTKVIAKENHSDDTDCEDIDIIPTQKVLELPIKSKANQRSTRIKSDSSTDCDDIEFQPTQKIQEIITENIVSNNKNNAAKVHKRVNRIDSDGSTDCEDVIPPQKVVDTKDDDLTDCEDDIIEINTKKTDNAESKEVLFEDMPTQVIDVEKQALEDMATQIIEIEDNDAEEKKILLEDQPTQIIDEIVTDHSNKESFKDIISPFKVPLQSPIKFKKDTKGMPKAAVAKSEPVTKSENYYDDTQEIYDDLCSQRPESPIIVQTSPLEVKRKDIQNKSEDGMVPCSVEDYNTANIERDQSPSKRFSDEKIKKYVSNLTKSQVNEVIGVSKLKKFPSDSSDVESTPKKIRPFLFTDSDLPSSQEIKTSMMLHTRSSVTESSSESEPEINSEDQYTPFLHRKKAPKSNAKKELVKKFEIDKLPERIITRKRKPTAKLVENYEEFKKITPNILKQKFLTEQDDQVDSDIITENIKRLKTLEKGKSKDETYKEEKKENISNKKTEAKKENKVEKFKVKIERPKRKETGGSTRSSRKSNEEVKDKSKDKLEVTSTSVSSTRSTRSRRKANDTTKSTSPENIKNVSVDTKRKRPHKKREKSNSPVRRSKRNQTAKSKKEEKQNKEKEVEKKLEISDKEVSLNSSDPMKAPKSILKKSIHEQSTVYNISSSSADSPKNLKRSLVDDNDVPSPKRTRSLVNNSNVINNYSNISNASLRATPARVIKTQNVLFTAFPSDEVKQKLEKLGAVIVTDVLSCSVVLTMALKRTFKLLCAMGLGRPIVGPNWVQACVDTHMVVDPWLYLIKDEAAEKRFQFSLDKTLKGKRNFLKGYNVSSTPSVQPNATEMKLIVECSGGVWKEGGSNWVCVTCTKDKALWPSLKKRGAITVSTEFILGGVLRQKIEIGPNEFK